MLLRQRSPRVCIAFKTLLPRAGSVRETGFCKRSVVAYGLRGVASGYGQTTHEVFPQGVLTGAFKKSRRAARTEKFMRMSRRLAGTKCSVQNCVRFGRVNLSEAGMSKASIASKRSSAWRPLSDVVSSVLRDVRIVPVAEVQRPAAAKLN